MALYLGKDKIAGFSTDSRIGDTLPVGAIIDYDGTEVPANWELVESSENGTGAIIVYDTDTNEVKYEKLLSVFNNETKEVVNSAYWIDSNNQILPCTGGVASPLAETTFLLSFILCTGSTVVNKTVTIDTLKQVVIAADLSDSNIIIDNINSTSTNKALSANQGRVLNEKIEAIPSQEITFTTRNFEEGTFTALRGMSWREWLNSDYNTLNSSWEILSASIELNAAYTLTYANDSAVKPWDIISGGEQYSGSK